MLQSTMNRQDRQAERMVIAERERQADKQPSTRYPGLALVIGLLAIMAGLAPAQRSISSPGLRPTRSITGRFSPTAGSELYTLRFSNGFSVDTRTGFSDVPAGWQADRSAPGPQLTVIQFTGPVERNWRRRLEREGIETFGYLAHYAVLARIDAAARARAAALPFVHWVGPFHPGYKLQGTLLDARGMLELALLVTPGADEAPVHDKLAELGALVHQTTRSPFGVVVRLQLTAAALPELARLDEVLWIEEWTEPDICNNSVQWVTQTGWQSTAPPDTSLAARRVWQQGVRGQGLILSTTDTGLNTGHDMFRDPAQTISPPGIWPDHRKVVAFKLFEGAHAGEAPRHGTHVTNTVAGCDSATGGSSFYDGAAKDARVYFVDVSASTGAFVLSSDLWPLWDTVYLGRGLPDSVRPIVQHSGSWGWSNNQGTYLVMDASTDAYCWAHKDFLNIMAAGNETNYRRLRNPGIAKNVLTIGATGRATASNTIASFSSRGPTQDGRLKPNVMAPGVNLWSARMAPETNTYEQLSGTSMATPAANGAVGLMRCYLEQGYYPTGAPVAGDRFTYISSALMRAMAMVSADPNIGTFTVPDSSIGWGRIDADSVLYFTGDARKLLIEDDTVGLATGEYAEATFRVLSGLPLRAGLAWTDTAAAPNANPTLVNNLNLELRSPGSVSYRGNQYSGGQSAPNPTSWDNLNVEELCRVNSPDTGLWTIRVYGQNVATVARQPFAWLVTGDIEVISSPTITTLNPSSGNRLWTGDVVFTGTGYIAPATADFGSGITVNSVTVNSPTQLTANISITTGAATGPRDVTVTTPGGTSDPVTFTVNNPAPTLASINPASGNRLQNLNVVFTGSNYIQGVSSVSFGAGITVHSVTVNSPTQLTANVTITAAAATGDRNVSVTNAGPGGGSSENRTFTVNNPAPTLASINPASGNRLWTGNVVFSGTNYIQGVSSVNFGPGITVNSVTVNSSTQLTANVAITAAAATGDRNVSVTNAGPGGGSSENRTFSVNNPAPTLASINPTAGARLWTGDVVFTGSNYIQGVSSVNFGPDITVNSVTVNSSTQLTANVSIGGAAAPGPRDVTVTNAGPGGGTSAPRTFTVHYPAPTLSGIDPTQGNRLQTLNVVFTGSNFFQDASTVNFGPNITVNLVTVNSPTQLTANVTITAAAATGDRDVSVTNSGPGGGSSETRTFSVYNPAPTLASINPASGNRLQTLNVVFSGTNYIQGVSSVNFGPGITVNSVTVNNQIQLTANVTIAGTAAAGPRDVSVTNAGPGGGSSETRTFNVNNPMPTLSTVVPSSGYTGQTLDVILGGTGYLAGVTSADFGADITVDAVLVTSQNWLTATISIDTLAAIGPRAVSVINQSPGGGIASLPGGFTVESSSDIGVVAVLAPAAEILPGPLEPAARWRNYRPQAADFTAFVSIFDSTGAAVYEDSAEVSGLPGDSTLDLAFAAWDATVGRWVVRCSTWCEGDLYPANDTASRAFRVLRRDVGLEAIVAPVGNIRPRPAAPVGRFANYGDAVETFRGYVTIEDTVSGTVVYSDSVEIQNVAPGQRVTRNLPGWEPALGYYRVTGWTALPGDEEPANDTARARVNCTPGPLGWAEETGLPSGSRPPQAGASLDAIQGETPRVYCLKGNKTGEFYVYDTEQAAWSRLPDLPAGPSGRPVRKGGAMTTDGLRHVYTLKGNKTNEFWRYDTQEETWDQLADLPPGARRLADGSGLAYAAVGDSEFVYCVKGSKTNEFYRYSVEAGTWEQLVDLPFGTGGRGFAKGSAFCAGANGLYALRGRFNEFYRYDPATGEWTDRQRFPDASPTGKRNRAGDGCALAADGVDVIYAFSGGNKQWFYGYSEALDRWTALETLPRGASRRRVKSGGALAHARRQVWAIKGNKSVEFWVYTPDTMLVTAIAPERPGLEALPGEFAPGRDGASSAGHGKPGPGILVGPNPARGELSLTAGDIGGPVQVELLSPLGAVLAERTLLPRARARIAVAHLPAGTYFIRFRQGDAALTRKIVISR